MDLFDMAKKIVLSNCSCDLDDHTVELLAVAVMALFLRDEKLANEKLPQLLQELKVFAEARSLREIAHDRLNNYSEDELLEYGDAGVTRTFLIDDENRTIVDSCALLISTNSGNTHPVNMVGKILHEFAHLLRYGGAIFGDEEVKVTKGLFVVRVSMRNNKQKNKHRILEEGVVQRYANQALDALSVFLENEVVPTGSLLYTLKKDYPNCFVDPYQLPVSIVDSLCQDKHFEELLETTFYVPENNTELAKYFNSVMGNAMAFTSFSRDVDCSFVQSVMNNEEASLSAIRRVGSCINEFKLRGKTKKF